MQIHQQSNISSTVLNDQSQFDQQISQKHIQNLSTQQLIQMLKSKDQIIRSFSQQITKYKVQQLKNRKLISSLQQKIEKTLQSNNNSSNSFMMPSQFKNLFNNFMTNTIPCLFSDFALSPKMYVIIVRKIMQAVYDKILHNLDLKIKKLIRALFNKQKPVQQNKCNVNSKSNGAIEQDSTFKNQKYKSNQQVEIQRDQQIKKLILPFLQRNFRFIFENSFNKQQQIQQSPQNQEQKTSHNFNYKKLLNIQFSYRNQNQNIKDFFEILNGNQPSQQILLFCNQLTQICYYMILQEKPWQFVFHQIKQDKHTNSLKPPIQQLQKIYSDQIKDIKIPNEDISIQTYRKKDYVCVDGFVKQGNQVIILLKCLRKTQTNNIHHYHPNNKNYQIPYYHNYQDVQIVNNAQNIHIQVLFIKQTQNQAMQSSEARQIYCDPCQQNYEKQNKSIKQHLKLNQSNPTKQELLTIQSNLNQLSKNSSQKQLNKISILSQKMIQLQQDILIQDLNKIETQYQIKNSQQSNSTNQQFISLNKKISKSTIVLTKNMQNSFKFDNIGQTQNSLIIQIQINRQQDNKKKDRQNLLQFNKQNVNSNIFIQSNTQKTKLTSQSKKDTINEKNITKKYKKQKNNSTIDLTSQKRKLSHNQKNIQEEFNQIKRKRLDMPLKKKYVEIPLNRKNNDMIIYKKQQQIPQSKYNKQIFHFQQVKNFSKRKRAGKSSRKCSVGKIISQSTQICASKLISQSTQICAPKLKQKMFNSQNNTMVLKQFMNTKVNRQQNANLLLSQIQQINDGQNKQNIQWFIDRKYEKSIIKPKKSSHLIIERKEDKSSKQQIKLQKSTKQNKNDKLIKQDKPIKQKKQDYVLKQMQQQNCYTQSSKNFKQTKDFKQKKEQRPLASRTNQNCFLIGKLRQKYLHGETKIPN